MSGPLGTAITAALPFVGFYFIFRLMFRGGSKRSSSRRSSRSSSVLSPTQMLRGRTGPNRNSSRPGWALWSAYALAMVLSAELVNNSASIYSGIATDASGRPTTRVVVALLVLIACVLAAIMAVPGGTRRHRALDLVGAALSVAVVLVDHWIGIILQAFIVIYLLRVGGTLGAVLQWGAVPLSYYLLSIHEGNATVVLSLVMTVLMGTLTMLLIVMTRSMGFAIALGIVVVVALVSGLAVPIN